MTHGLLIIALLVASCCPPPVECSAGVAGQCDAERIAWHDLLGEAGPPPSVRMVEAAISNDGHAVDGYYTPWCDCGAAHWTGSWSAENGRSAYDLAHELLHAHLQRKYGDDDQDHLRLGWGTARYTGFRNGGAPWGYLDGLAQQLIAVLP